MLELHEPRLDHETHMEINRTFRDATSLVAYDATFYDDAPLFDVNYAQWLHREFEQEHDTHLNHLEAVFDDSIPVEYFEMDEDRWAYACLTLSIEMLRLAAKDLVDAKGQPEGSERWINGELARVWLTGELDEFKAKHADEEAQNDAPSSVYFSFKLCLRLLNTSMREQSMGHVFIENLEDKDDVLANWILHDPKNAEFYLKNYQTVFESQSSIAEKRDYDMIYEQSKRLSCDGPSS